MGVRILAQRGHLIDYACFYCSTSMWAFGPVMGSVEEAEAFLKWLDENPRTKSDPRLMSEHELELAYSAFLGQVIECGKCGEWHKAGNDCL